MKLVKTYDFETKRQTQIPVAELAPGMVRANVEGVGEVYVRAAQARWNVEYRHPPLEEKWRDLIGMIKARLDEVFPKTVEEWEDGFRRDSDLEKEIGIWCHIATAYTVCKEKLDIPRDKRQECFAIVLSIFNNGPEHALETVSLEEISLPLAKRIVDFIVAGAKADT